MEAFNRDTAYWDNYYRNTVINDASLFAYRVKEDIIKGKHILDIGCGNGRDSIFFINLGMVVTGIDASYVAIKKLKETFGDNTKHCFVCDDFVTSKDVYDKKYDYCYSRFSIHAINDEQEMVLLNNVYNSLNKNGNFFIETRCIRDNIFGLGKKINKNTYIYNDHYRRFIDKDELINRLKKIGFLIDYAEENTGFAPYGDSDPVILRIIAKKI